MENPEVLESGLRKYYKGTLWGIDTVVVVARVGKVAAAVTTTHLLTQFNVDMVIFTGVGGAADESLNIGDVVVANGLIQHDMDATPLTPLFTIPFLRIKTFCPDEFLQKVAYASSQQFLDTQLNNSIDSPTRAEFKIAKPKVIYGAIASGDKFFADKTELQRLKNKLPEVMCVEMEGAAVAQVCYEYDVPCVVIRTISDHASKNADIDCMKFMRQVSCKYAESIIKNVYINFSSSESA